MLFQYKLNIITDVCKDTTFDMTDFTLIRMRLKKNKKSENTQERELQ